MSSAILLRNMGIGMPWGKDCRGYWEMESQLVC